MPRAARIAPQEFVYHILTRGNNRQVIFQDEEDYQKYISILQKYKEKYEFQLYHYVLMTNHIHLVIEPTDTGGTLSQIMKGINLSYAQHYKAKYKYIGHLWQDRYKSIIISKDEYLLACGSYVELNPVRAKMVDDPKDYPWSSYRAYAYRKQDSLIDEYSVYFQLSREEKERRGKYRDFVRSMLRSKEAMKGVMDRRLVYGSNDFVKSMLTAYNIAEKIKRIGRQRGWRKNKKNKRSF